MLLVVMLGRSQSELSLCNPCFHLQRGHLNFCTHAEQTILLCRRRLPGVRPSRCSKPLLPHLCHRVCVWDVTHESLDLLNDWLFVDPARQLAACITWRAIVAPEQPDGFLKGTLIFKTVFSIGQTLTNQGIGFSRQLWWRPCLNHGNANRLIMQEK